MHREATVGARRIEARGFHQRDVDRTQRRFDEAREVIGKILLKP